MKKDYTHLVLIVDRSGSMYNVAADASGGINSLIEEQTKLDGEFTVTLYQFDNRYERVFGPIPGSEAPKYTLMPGGSTALLDATGRAITETGKFLRDMDEADRPDQVMCVIVTDGEENASREFNRSQIKEMINEQTNKYNWDFAYLGANVDAFGDSRSFGISGYMQYSSNSTSVRDSYGLLGAAITTNRLTKSSFASTLANNADDPTTNNTQSNVSSV